jgi:membrane-associated protein
MDFNPLDLILHLDVYLDLLVTNYGPWIYAILFLVIFCETGLVVMPFLPGDSLLFIAGAVAAGGGMDPVLLAGLLMLAAILGDSTNYVIGRTAGERCSATRTRKSSAATTCKKPTTSMTSTAAKP